MWRCELLLCHATYETRPENVLIYEYVYRKRHRRKGIEIKLTVKGCNMKFNQNDPKGLRFRNIVKCVSILIMFAMVLLVTIIPNKVNAVDSDFVIVEGVLTEYKGNSKKVTIPNYVTSIGEGAFYNCSNITNITIPTSVISIGNQAFQDCSNLTSITIPEAVTSIEDFAFYDCSSLTDIAIPVSVTSIGYAAFNYTPWLKTLQKDDPFVIINNILIDGRTCTGIVTIPNTMTSIGEGAFEYCSSITSITIPDSVSSIGDFAFDGCSNLINITIPTSVTSIGYWTFYNTPWLKARQNENPLVIINNILIDGTTCTGIVIIPDFVTSIGEGAFEGCNFTEPTLQ